MYTEFYGLRAQPFRLTPDPSYFFSSATHKSAMAYMRYGIQQGEGFIVITGAPGTGKTTLAQTLIGVLPRNATVIGELVTTQLQPEDLLRAIAAAFELGVDGTKSDLIGRLQGFFRTRTRAGKHIILVIDEAHDLPPVSFEELRMLSNFHQGPHAVLQCILLGQLPLRDMLTQATMDQFQQRVLASHQLEPLSLIETRGYILHRLQQAGWRGDPSFTANAIKLIHQYAQGIPRRINALCTRLMLYGYLEEEHQIEAAATIRVYNEWMQELGESGSVIPLRQPQPEENSVSELTKEHVILGHAVGLDAHPVFAEPKAPKNMKVASVSTISVQSNKSTAEWSEETVQSILSELTEIISRRSYPMMPDNKRQSAAQSQPHVKASWLLIMFIVLVAVIIVAGYFTDINIYYHFSAGQNAPQSQIQPLVAP